ncbi:hypothetical protein FZ025_14900 [Xanthomonas hyacinthi]|uniref:Uncharacterized protein n=1 Tax=Xanthomonas hyacinthi TaxID=56455 RepID=A0A2S7ET94_9XANT|nr:hypothetical protein XhyaCFBP1156_15450 [Xanthomonas hyacinthi]QGY77859.1 hypothetical protein FZ025_14900 [Xanthomonas hyacinthi]
MRSISSSRSSPASCRHYPKTPDFTHNDPRRPSIGREDLATVPEIKFVHNTVELGKYKYSQSREPSENSVRAEHGLPKRVSYHHFGYRSE